MKVLLTLAAVAVNALVFLLAFRIATARRLRGGTRRPAR